MERNLAMDLVRVTEAAALASARYMGRGDDVAADTASVEAMRRAFDAIAIDEPGSLLRVPDTYMEKIACGPEGRGVIDLDRSPSENLHALAEAKGVYVEDMTVVILDRPRHVKL